jgi:hypothetical protein
MDNQSDRTHGATDEHDHEDDDDGITPQGAFLFVMLMLAGYIVYWGYVWYLVAIERG